VVDSSGRFNLQIGQEEQRIAISKNCTCLGDPTITVILIGGGVNVPINILIMQRAGWGLSLDWRHRRYCSVCSRTEDSPPHTCYKNWDGSSSAMESSIITEGFKQCVQQHGVKYSKFIGNRDSSIPFCFLQFPGILP